MYGASSRPAEGALLFAVVEMFYAKRVSEAASRNPGPCLRSAALLHLIVTQSTVLLSVGLHTLSQTQLRSAL